MRILENPQPFRDRASGIRSTMMDLPPGGQAEEENLQLLRSIRTAASRLNRDLSWGLHVNLIRSRGVILIRRDHRKSPKTTNPKTKP